MKLLKKLIILTVKRLDLGSAIAVRLIEILGKSKSPVHPKHFLYKKPWFAKYIKNTDTALDLGSGNGQNTIKAAYICKKVIGVELDDNLLEISRNSSQRAKLSNVKFEKTNLEEKLKFADSMFSAVIFLDVLEHLNKRDRALREIKRVLKPKGLLLLSVPNNATSWKKFQRSAGVCSFSDPDHKIEFSEGAIKKLLNSHNLKIVNVGYDAYDVPYRGLIDVIGALYLPFYKKISKWRMKKAQKFPHEAGGFQIVAQNVK